MRSIGDGLSGFSWFSLFCFVRKDYFVGWRFVGGCWLDS
jgi:hypothetical protein